MIKNKFKIVLLVLFIIILITSCQSSVTNTKSLKLWYSQPANSQIPDDMNSWKDDPEWL